MTWTGSLVLVFGGAGARYDPAINFWSPMTSAGASPGSQGASDEWTGTDMFTFGGFGGLNRGARYYP
jgi:hypothetical protein